MAECPGVLHLAAMADGGLARIRTPGGGLSAAQARAVAQAAAELGSGAIDLTNRANLQIRGLALDAGLALGKRLAAVGLGADGPADRRRNILLDPFAGLDPAEAFDLAPLGAALDAALTAAPWIGGLSVKFSFVLDGGGRAGIGAVPSDVICVAGPGGSVTIRFGASAVEAEREAALPVLLALAEIASHGALRGHQLPRAQTLDVLSALPGVRVLAARPEPRVLAPRYGAIPTNAGAVALAVPVAVGRLDAATLHWLADRAERDGDGALRLAPWSAVVLTGVAAERAPALLAEAEAIGLPPVSVVERLRVTACAGAPSCERAREPAKALGAAVLALAARDPSALPLGTASLHLSACPKGCAGSTPADLLLLGATERPGWTLHADSAPRAPGPAIGALDDPEPADILHALHRAGQLTPA